MSVSPEKHAWPQSRLAEALDALATRSGLAPRGAPTTPVPADLSSVEIARFIESAASLMGIEAEPVEAAYPEIEPMLSGSGPAVARLPNGMFLLLISGTRKHLTILRPDFIEERIAVPAARDALTQDLAAPVVALVNRLLRGLSLSPEKCDRARAAMVRDRLSQARVGGIWMLRLPPGASFRMQARRLRLVRYGALFLIAHLTQYLLWIYAWWVLGRGALEGNLNWGWMAAWALILASIVPLRAGASWYQGWIAIGLGALLKQRLLAGALKLTPEETRHQGTGHHLGRVIESEAVEALVLAGGFLAVVSTLELAVLFFVLTSSAGSFLHGLVLAGWAAVGALVALRFYRERSRWTAARLALSHDLVERMVGHRTRLAQQPPERWHDGEDQALEGYFDRSRAMDRTGAVMAVLSRGWMIVGLLGLAPAFVSGEASLPRIAVSLGGTLLAAQAFAKLFTGFSLLSAAAIAWKQASPLFHAAARPEPVGDPSLAVTAKAPADIPVLEASEVTYRYKTRAEPVLRGLSLRVGRADRILLESRSGGGKSTLASLLNGMRSPDSGLLLLHGLDRRSFGAEAWTRRVATAPQFHENHVITETFGFNLLMGRGWPPEPGDLEEAETLCRKLGLGELIDRMPAGLLQMVGEMGWQLSHGEKSRLYIARTLLQDAEVILLDESFGALDPRNMKQALDLVLERAPALVVIAHP